MPLTKLLQSLKGQCRYCGQQTGLLKRDHPECRQTHQAGFKEMVQLAAQAAAAHSFNEVALRQSLQAIAQRCYATDLDIEQALEEGFARGIAQALTDGIMIRDEENRLRAFRDHLALEDNAAGQDAIWDLERASGERLILEARLAAISVHDGDDHLQDLDEAMLEARLGPDQRKRILIRAWETAVEGALEDGLVSLDEENALAKYADHFALTQQELDGNRAQTSLVQAVVIRNITQGIIPQRQNVRGHMPFNLMKSEQLVWVIDGVDYLETLVRRERRGTYHGISVRVARGLYYRPSTFRSRPIEWEETVHADTGLLGLTTKHVYFAGSQKKFRVRYDRIVSFEPTLQRWARYHAGCPDGQAADFPDQRRLVCSQPGREFVVDVAGQPKPRMSRSTHGHTASTGIPTASTDHCDNSREAI